jgi:uncharacterized Zn finger protein (UPF0148 family)
VIDDLSDYEHRGDPLAEHAMTTKDKRRQQEAERIRAHARKVAGEAPPLSAEQIATLRRIFTSVRTQPPSERMRWRLRLYCGHVVERTAHCSHQSVHAAFTGSVSCPNCGLDPATIIAAAPLGLESELANSQRDKAEVEAELARVTRQTAAADRERQRLTARAAKLRQELDAARPNPTTDRRPFVAHAGGDILHEDGCRFVAAMTEANQNDAPYSLLTFTSAEADEWLRATKARRRCRTCAPYTPNHG